MLASTLRPRSACHRVGTGPSEGGQNVEAEAPHPSIHPSISTTATAESETWRCGVSGGIKKPWQINRSRAGIPLAQLTDISFYGRFANKV